MTKFPPIHVLEDRLRMIAELCEMLPGHDQIFDRMEAIVKEARAAELDDPVARMRARREAHMGRMR